MTVECPRSCPAGVEAECLTYDGQDPMDRCRWTAMDLTNANTEVVRYQSSIPLPEVKQDG